MTEEELNTEKVELGMQHECKDFQSFQVFGETVEDDFEADQSAGKKPELVKSNWVLRKKPNESVKARCVITRADHDNFSGTFVTVPTSVAIRILLAWALQYNLDVWIGSVHVTFPHADLSP